MRSVLHASRIAKRNPQDYEARSNLMWTATWALNTLIAKGKSTDWMVHACSCFTAVLPPHLAVRPAEIQALRH